MDTIEPPLELDAPALERAAPLAGIGRKSGDLVVGLSAVRRTQDLALIVLESSLSRHTFTELARRRRAGVLVFQVDSLSPLTAAIGRQDARVVGVKRGPLAEGVIARLQDG